jgi:hypothetical protein
MPLSIRQQAALRGLFGLEAVVDVAFGVGLLTVPGMVLSLYAISTDTTGTFFARFAGATLVGFGLLAWMARGWSDRAQLRTLIRIFFVTTTLGVLAALDFQLQPGVPVQAAAFVILTAVFFVAWGYFAWLTRSTIPG